MILRLLIRVAGRKNLLFIEMEKIGKEICLIGEEELSLGCKFKMLFGYIIVFVGGYLNIYYVFESSD